MECRIQRMACSKDADFMLSLDGDLFTWGKNTALIQRPEIKDKTDADVPGQSKIYVNRRLKETMADYGKNKNMSFDTRQIITKEITSKRKNIHDRGRNIEENLIPESEFVHDL